MQARQNVLKHVFLVIFLIVSALGWRAFGTTAMAAVWVESVEGNSADIVILRDGAPVRAAKLMQLKQGDRIEIRARGAKLGVLLEDQSVHVVTFDNSPYVVPKAAGGSSFFDNLLKHARALLQTGADDTETVVAITRGKSKPLRLLAAPVEENFLLAGEAELNLRWQGGRRPYMVRLTGLDDDQTSFEQQNIGKTVLVISDLQLGSGSYELTISSGSGSRVSSLSTTLTVVEPEDLPGEIRKIQTAKLPTQLKKLALVAALAGDEEWRLQAYSLARTYKLKDAERAILTDKVPARRLMLEAK